MAERPTQQFHIATVLVAGIALLGALVGVPAAIPDGDECPDATAVFARGSGQPVGAREATTYLSALEGLLAESGAGGDSGDTIRLNVRELGDAGHGGFRYPAVGGREALIGARVDQLAPGRGSAYRESVDAGRREMVAAVSELLVDCPDQLLVLAGYSQGAQVVGEALFELSEPQLEAVAHVSLFGDPTLLVNGTGVVPTACFGDRQPWRRGNIRCYHDGGILGPRDPYVPARLEDRTASWCDKQDGVCTGNEVLAFDGAHAEYHRDEIPRAAEEAAEALRLLSARGR